MTTVLYYIIWRDKSMRKIRFDYYIVLKWKKLKWKWNITKENKTKQRKKETKRREIIVNSKLDFKTEINTFRNNKIK